MNRRSSPSMTVLLLAPTANDGNVAVDALGASGIEAISCKDISQLCHKIRNGCGSVIISEEALSVEALAELQDTLESQEAWSDLPIILLTNADVVKATEIFSKSGNISLLERPFSKLTLIRSAQVALRARSKQYQVRDLMLELQHSKDEAERANSAKSQFLANMSHEIRTPIGAIVGFIEILKGTSSLEAEETEYMNIIDRNSQHLLRLIDDILDLSKVEAGKMAIEPLELDLKGFLTEFISQMKLSAAEKNLKFQVMVDSKIPNRIITDVVRLRQILANVVGNAIKFTDRGFVELNIEYKNPRLKFSVTDTGVGLTPEQSLKLFRPFAHADSSTTRRYGGTGLGLVLSKKLAQALGGDLVLESSTLGVGSRFAITIEPTYPSGFSTIDFKQPLAPIHGVKSSAPNPQLDNMKILVIEDSPDNQYLLEMLLAKTGADLVFKSNGQEGVNEAFSNTFDVVLMDLQMPVMDGHQATRELRQGNFAKPIIALTAHAMEKERKNCMKSGFSDYLTKPINKEALMEALLRNCSKPA